MKHLKSLAFVAPLLLLCSCASLFKYVPEARNVKKQPQIGGIIALNLDNRAEDRELADSMMQKNCGAKKVSVLEEGEVVIGTVTTSSTETEKANKHKTGKLFGMDVMSGHDGREDTASETVQKKEWQISYRCTT
jgi:hypothetical protein